MGILVQEKRGKAPITGSCLRVPLFIISRYFFKLSFSFDFLWDKRLFTNMFKTNRAATRFLNYFRDMRDPHREGPDMENDGDKHVV